MLHFFFKSRSTTDDRLSNDRRSTQQRSTIDPHNDRWSTHNDRWPNNVQSLIHALEGAAKTPTCARCTFMCDYVTRESIGEVKGNQWLKIYIVVFVSIIHFFTPTCTIEHYYVTAGSIVGSKGIQMQATRRSCWLRQFLLLGLKPIKYGYYSSMVTHINRIIH